MPNKLFVSAKFLIISGTLIKLMAEWEMETCSFKSFITTCIRVVWLTLAAIGSGKGGLGG